LGTSESLLEALNLLKKYREYSESVYNNLRTIEIALLQAQANLKSGHDKDAVNVLRYALELAAEGEWIRPFVESGNEVNDLLMKLKGQSVQPEFLNQILVKVGQKEEIHSVVSRQETGNTEMKQDGDRVLFTTRELEVFKYVEEGLRNKEIAAKLFISDDAIKKHLYNMFQKIGVNNRISLIKQARELGYIENREMLSE
jgi:LuxR family maltose regulon positive regulatory protein